MCIPLIIMRTTSRVLVQSGHIAYEMAEAKTQGAGELQDLNQYNAPRIKVTGVVGVAPVTSGRRLQAATVSLIHVLDRSPAATIVMIPPTIAINALC